MDEDGPRAADEEPEPGRAKTFIRLNDLSGAGGRPGPGEREVGSGDSEAEALPYPALAPVVFFYLSQESRPRSWCLRLVCNPYPLQVRRRGKSAAPRGPLSGWGRGCSSRGGRSPLSGLEVCRGRGSPPSATPGHGKPGCSPRPPLPPPSAPLSGPDRRAPPCGTLLPP